MRQTIIGLSALGLLATAPARADEKVEQKSETKTSRDGKHRKHHREAKHTRDTPNGKVTDTSKSDAETKVKMGGGTVSTTEKTVDRSGPGNGGKVKKTTKVERDAAGNVTHTETDVKK
ncbi:MAG: hypothetical protein NVSMB23_21240 [Myxococcales bacterium]